MKVTRRTLLGAAGATLAAPALGQPRWPDRPVEIVVGFVAGGATDLDARAVAPLLEKRLGGSVVVVNRPGAGGEVALASVARARPDGHVLGTTNMPGLLTIPIERQAQFKLEDFAGIANMVTDPTAMTVHEDSPYRTLADLIAAARARPEGITYATASSSQQVAAASLAAMANIRMLAVPYRSSPLAVQDLLAGRVDLFIADQAVILPQAQSGAVRMLGVTSAARSPSVPDVPTVREAGNLPDYEVIAWFCLFAPAGTPADRIATLNRAAVAAIGSATMRDRLQGALGMSMRPSTPEEAAAFVRAETTKWTNAVRQAGIEPQ